MTQFARSAVPGSVLLALFLASCATEAPTTPKVQPKSIPGLSVVIDCGACQVRPTVAESIRASYAAAAAKAGVPIAGDTQVTLTIKDYTERGLAIRTLSFVAGPLAFALKDEIRAVALVGGKPIPLEYHYRIPFRGIDAVASKLGELSFDALVK